MNLTQKQQYTILGVILGIGALALLFVFVVQPMMDKKAEDIKKATELEEKNKKMKDEVKQRQEIENKLEKSKSTLINFDQYIPKPVLGNYLLRMEEYINHCAEGLQNLVIKGIVDNDSPQINSGGNVVFRFYRVRVNVIGGYNDLVRFIYKLQKENPLVTISGMSITATGETQPNRLEIMLLVSWLIWDNPSGRPDFLIAAESNKIDAIVRADVNQGESANIESSEAVVNKNVSRVSVE